MLAVEHDAPLGMQVLAGGVIGVTEHALAGKLRNMLLLQRCCTLSAQTSSWPVVVVHFIRVFQSQLGMQAPASFMLHSTVLGPICLSVLVEARRS